MRCICLLFLYFIVTVSDSEAQNSTDFPLPTRNVTNKIQLFEGEKITVYPTLSYTITNKTSTNKYLVLKCWMDYVKVASLVNWTDVNLSTEPSSIINVDVNVTVLAKRLGGSRLFCAISIDNKDTNSTSMIHQDEIALLIVKRIASIEETVFRFAVMFFVIFLTFVMGCELDIDTILKYIQKPVSPAIGFICQFVFMPLMSLALATSIDNAFGFGLLTIGCSPGGGASNIWTVLFGGDLNLSMTMTFISSCAALLMMPFWLFVLGRFFIDPSELTIPYLDIGLNLLQVVIPVGVGMLFRWKYERTALRLTKKVKIMGLVFIIFILTYGSYVNRYLFQLMADYPYLVPIGASLPWLGFVMGYALSMLTRRPRSQAIAISLETGIQNIGIAILILKFSMPQPAGDLGVVMPIVVALFTPLPLYIVLAVLTVKRKCYDTATTSETTEILLVNREQKNVLLNDVAV